MKNNLLKLGIKTIIYSLILIIICIGLFFAYFFLKGGISKTSIIMFKANYLTSNIKCIDLSIKDTEILNKNFNSIGLSGGLDYWCNIKKIHFFQSNEKWVNNINGKKTYTGSLMIPKEIGKLINISEISFTNIKINGGFPNEIGNLKNLVKLQINGTGIKKLPKEIEKLDKLQILYIEKYLYATLPEKIMKKIENKKIIDYSSLVK